MRTLILVFFLISATTLTLHSAETNDVLQLIENMCTLDDKEGRSLGVSIRDGIEKNPAKYSNILAQKLGDEKLTERQQGVYVWALGLTGDQTVAKEIISLFKKSKSNWVKENALRTLAMLGGKETGEFLLSILDETTDKDTRFSIFNWLGQVQFEAALPKAEEVLKQDKEHYWQPIFVFGKMGDKAVSFLLKKISDSDTNVRRNALTVLGQWLIPLEASKPLQDRFWIEKDSDLRYAILCSLEGTMPDLTHVKTFFAQVMDKEKDKQVRKFARDTLDSLERTKSAAITFSEKRQPSEPIFQREYSLLFKSSGKKGSYEVLGLSSTLKDEPKLKTLREHILQRDSDEAFYDYQKVNRIIVQNRLIESISDNKKTQKLP